jgi:hypothetical protein
LEWNINETILIEMRGERKSGDREGGRREGERGKKRGKCE